MDPLSVTLCFAAMYVVGLLMYRSARAGWRPNYRPDEITDLLIWRDPDSKAEDSDLN
jgi:hypothetical protein